MPTLAGLATGDSNFGILVGVLQHIDANIPGSALVATLDDAAADLTVFAPTNAAFGALAADLGFDGDVADTAAVASFLIGELPVATLDTVVRFHLASGSLSSTDIASAMSVTTLQGGTIGAGELPTLTDAEPDLIDPSLVATDIAADNGVLHVIDRVLLPVDLPGNDAPTIAGIVAASGDALDGNGADFDILLAAVNAAGLTGALDDADADLTVFAPNDAAFVLAAQALGFRGDTEAGALNYILDAAELLGRGDTIGLLSDVLTYHVAPESLQASQVLAASTITTLQGGEITVNGTSLGDLEPDLPDPSIIATDIQAANGIVHVIDGVLIPVDLLVSDGSNDVDFIIGRKRADRIDTGDDTDFVAGRGAADRITLGDGDDVGTGGGGADRLLGQAGDDYLDGGRGRDIVKGGDGDDVLIGGHANDRLYGGEGSDTFVITDDSRRDRIEDFEQGTDVIDLSAFGLSGFDALEITGGHNGARIVLDGATVRVAGLEPDLLTADDFLF